MADAIPEVEPCAVCESCEIYDFGHAIKVRCQCMGPGGWMTLERWRVRLEQLARPVVTLSPKAVRELTEHMELTGRRLTQILELMQSLSAAWIRTR